MKRTIAIILTVLFIVVLFVGCGGSGETNNTPATKAPEVTKAPEATAEPDSPYNFAAGKFKADDRGIALEKYDYTLPLTTSDEVITVWSTCYTPEYLPEEGYDAVELPLEVKKRTGVNVETTLVTAAQRSENFAVLLASDSLLDIMCAAVSCYTSGPFEQLILEEGYFVNLYDYRAYMPNYLYEATKDPNDRDTINRVFKKSDLIMAFYELRAEKELSSGAFARGDWLEDMGKTNDDIKTFDDYHDMFYFFKTVIGCDTPMTLLNTLELAGAYEFTGYDTYACAAPTSTQYVVDGKVHISCVGDNDRDLMTMLSQWYSEGLIDPNWTSYSAIPDIGDKLQTGKMGYIAGTRATTMKSNDVAIPEGEKYGWVPMTKPLRYEGQTLHMGFQTNRVYWGSASIACTCENIELACTWLDWRYGEEGSFLYGYGVQGVSWDYDEDGNIVISNFIVDHPGGWTMIMLTYALNSITEPGLYINYAYNAPGNEIALEYLRYWESIPHDDVYVYPTGIAYTDDQNEVISNIGSDLTAYVQEKYLAFVDGSVPMSEWDNYVKGIYDMGLEELLAVYQEAYDAYME